MIMPIRQPKHVTQKGIAEQAVGIILEHHRPNEVDLVGINLGREGRREGEEKYEMSALFLSRFAE